MCSIFATCSTVYASNGSLTSFRSWVVPGRLLSLVTRSSCLCLCLWVRFPAITYRRTCGRRRRQSRCVIDYGSPASAADLDHLAHVGQFAQPEVDPRAAHAGRLHQLGHGDPVVWSKRQGCPQDLFGSVLGVGRLVIGRVGWSPVVPVAERSPRRLIERRPEEGVAAGRVSDDLVGDEVGAGSPGRVVFGGGDQE